MRSQATIQIFEGPGSLRLTTRALPWDLAAGELLVEISLAAICGSDLHTIDGRRSEPTPAILGHEGIGTVTAIGPGSAAAAGHPAIGDRITWTIANSCFECRFCTDLQLPEKCLSLFKYGHASLQDGSGLNGTFASHVLLRSGTHVVPLPDHVSDAVAVPANCALATAVNAVSHLPEQCPVVVVQGAGILGLYACALLDERRQRCGIDHIFCVDVDESRLALVERFGATPIRGDLAQDEELITAAAPHGVDAVLELAGAPQLVPVGIRLLRAGGFYSLVGMVHPDSALEITGEQIIRKCLTLRGVHNYSPVHLDEAVAFLARTVDRYPFEALISPAFPLAQLNEAIEAAAQRLYPRISLRPQLEE